MIELVGEERLRVFVVVGVDCVTVGACCCRVGEDTSLPINLSCLELWDEEEEEEKELDDDDESSSSSRFSTSLSSTGAGGGPPFIASCTISYIEFCSLLQVSRTIFAVSLWLALFFLCIFLIFFSKSSFHF